MDMSQYLEIFLDETKEHLNSLNKFILELEQNPESMDTINEIFRAAHSLKGVSGIMGYKRMQALTHEMENVFSEVRNGTILVQEEIVDVMFQCLDALEEYLATIIETSDEGVNENEPLIRALKNILLADDDKKNEDVSPKEELGVLDEVKNKWDEITLNDTEKTVCKEAIELGENIYGINVKVNESCLLKAARAFLVFKAIEEHGEILISSPPTDDIEDEKFDLDFTLVVISKSKLDVVIAAIKNVSEIEDATGGALEFDFSDSNEEAMEVIDEEINEKKNSKDNKTETSSKTSTNEAKTKPSKPVVNRTVRVDLEKLDVLMNLVSELIIAKNSLVSATEAEKIGESLFREHIEYIESVTTNLHESVMKVRMVSIESVVSKFPRMIRDLSKKLDKKMELYMSGEETELDRTVVDEIGDPLMHLLRNSADHGLETAEKRLKLGKPEIGSINLNAFQDGNNVIIEVRDDGGGINPDIIGNKAIQRGIITEEQFANMEDHDIINLIFAPGFSTADVISDVSGRGVGLDVVKSKIGALSGEVEVRSVLNEGSIFTIRLPLTLAIIQALMVRVGHEKYALSLGAIQTIENIKPEEISLVYSKEVINLRGNIIPIVRLNELLDIKDSVMKGDHLVVVIVKKGDKLAGIIVDELAGQQDIVIKSLGKYISKSRYISGATILGDGEVALIVDTNAVI